MLHLADMVPGGTEALAKATGDLMRASALEHLVQMGMCVDCASKVVTMASQQMLAEDLVSGFVRWGTVN